MTVKKQIKQLARKGKNLPWATGIARALEEAQKEKRKDKKMESFEKLMEVISSEIEDAFPTELLRRDTVVYSREADEVLKDVLKICSTLHSKLPEPVAAFETCLFKIFSKVTYIGVTKLSQNVCTVADLLKEMTKLLLRTPFHPSQDHPDNRKQQVLKLCQNFMTLTQSQAASEEDNSEEEEEDAIDDGEFDTPAGEDESAMEDANPVDASPVVVKTDGKKKKRRSGNGSPVAATAEEPSFEPPGPKKKRRKGLDSSVLNDCAAGTSYGEPVHETPVDGGQREEANECSDGFNESSKKKKKKKKKKDDGQSSSPGDLTDLGRGAVEGGNDHATGGKVESVPEVIPDEDEEPRQKKKKKKKMRTPADDQNTVEAGPSPNEIVPEVIPDEEEQPRQKKKKKIRIPVEDQNTVEAGPSPNEVVPEVIPDEEEQPHKRKKKKIRVPADDQNTVEAATADGCPPPDLDDYDDLLATPRLTQLFKSPPGGTEDGEKRNPIPRVPPYWMMDDYVEETTVVEAVQPNSEAKKPSLALGTSSTVNEDKRNQVGGPRRSSPAHLDENSNFDLFAESSQLMRRPPDPVQVAVATENADKDNAESGYEEEANDYLDGGNSVEIISDAEDEEPPASLQNFPRAEGVAQDAGESTSAGSPVILEGPARIRIDDNSPGDSKSGLRRPGDAQSGLAGKSAESTSESANSSPRREVDVQLENWDETARHSTDGLAEARKAQPQEDEIEPADSIASDALVVDLEEDSHPGSPDDEQTAAEPELTLKTEEKPATVNDQPVVTTELATGSNDGRNPPDSAGCSTQLDCKFILDCLVGQGKTLQDDSVLDEDVEFIEEIKTMTAGWVRDEASSEEEIDWDQVRLVPESPAKPTKPEVPRELRRSRRLAGKRGPDEQQPPKANKRKRSDTSLTPKNSSANITISTEPVTFMDRLMQHLPACWTQRLQQEDPHSFCAPAPHDHLVHLPCVGGEDCHPYEHQHTIRLPCTCYGGSQIPYGADTPTSMPVSTSWVDKEVVSPSENEEETPSPYRHIKTA